MRVLIIIPTYNERENIGRLVPTILEQDPAIDVLIVDDNSPDGTGELADQLARKTSRVAVIHRAGKLGLGTAYLTGFQYGLARNYECMIEMDADFSHSPADLSRLLEPVRTGEADLVLGSRWVAGGGTRNWPLHRKMISRGGSLYARAVLGVPIRDLTGGFKCFHRRVLQALDLDDVRTVGYGFQIELTYRAIRAGFRVCEIPIIFTERVHGVSKMSTRIASEAIRVVWQLRLGRRATDAHRKVAV